MLISFKCLRVVNYLQSIDLAVMAFMFIKGCYITHPMHCYLHHTDRPDAYKFHEYKLSLLADLQIHTASLKIKTVCLVDRFDIPKTNTHKYLVSMLLTKSQSKLFNCDTNGVCVYCAKSYLAEIIKNIYIKV